MTEQPGLVPPDDTAAFLSSSPVFRDSSPQEIARIAPLFRLHRFPAGTVILRQGGVSEGIYFLRSGTLAVRVERGDTRETIAILAPPEIFGELSFLTGRACVADVEVAVDAEVLFLHRDSVPALPEHREAILRGLLRAVAGRLQQTVSRGGRAIDSPIVLLRNLPHWPAPVAFAFELACSLGRQTGRRTVLVNVGAVESDSQLSPDASAVVCQMPVRASDLALRAVLAEHVAAWRGVFQNVILNPVGPEAAPLAVLLQEFANCQGYLAGPGDPFPAEEADATFVVQTGESPTLNLLNGSRQLIWQAADAEREHQQGRSTPERFRRTADSIARYIAGTQVGLALGGGAAWGWAHIGVLEILEEAGIPIDMITGCSMGSVIGALRAAGFLPAALQDIAAYWRSHTARFIEWRLWNATLINERMVFKVFGKYFGDRQVNQTDIPYWANAVDIRVGREFAIQEGSLVHCIRASIALPGLLPPASHDTRLLLDAGIMDPVPVQLLRRMGCHFAIGVNAMSKPAATVIRRGYPWNALDIMTRCMFLMGHEIGQAQAEKVADVVFTPDMSGITMLEFKRAPEIIERGRKAARKYLPAIIEGYRRLRERSSMPAESAEKMPV